MSREKPAADIRREEPGQTPLINVDEPSRPRSRYLPLPRRRTAQCHTLRAADSDETAIHAAEV